MGRGLLWKACEAACSGASVQKHSPWAANFMLSM